MLNYIQHANLMAGTPKIKYSETFKMLYDLTYVFILLGLIQHCISEFIAVNYYPVIVDFFAIILFSISYILKITKKISQKFAGSFIIYALFLNICILDNYYVRVNNSSTFNYFLFSIFILAILIVIIGLIVDMKHVLIMGVLSIIRLSIFAYYFDNPLLWSVFVNINVIFVGVIFSFYLIMRKMKADSLEKNKNEQAVYNQNIEFNKLLRFKDDMLNMILHDIKNPMNLIIAAGNDSTITKTEIAESGKQVLLIAENILDISKMKESKMRLNLACVPFNNVVYDALNEVDYLLKQKKLLIINGFSENYMIRIDENLMKRLMVNLLTNAIKSSKMNDYIEIRFILHEGMLRVEVIDNGKGISPEFISKIFDKFYQEEINDSIYNRSVGLGLTFCKLVVDTHKGKIGAESELDKGTTIWFEFPLEINPVSKLHDSTVLPSEEVVNFNRTDKKTLLIYKKKLAILDIYQTGEMYKMLYTCNSDGSESLINWKDQIINASMTGDIENFEKLRKISS